ncbi:glycosyltransferase family 2 protein [Paracoccus albus]|uniref:glycosyltransferase family 2 protein n=1 Tax=Paracoccus albus TaxID=3017784 RepID=UPI0022F1167E|nr:glycosyltransferase family 2 protein [Paracoccus albus]WBU61365.1 glycosyltransferase family 2 protein [Paracoccus albus]
MAENWLSIICVPSMSVMPLRVMQLLHLSGAEVMTVTPGVAPSPELSAGRISEIAHRGSLPTGKDRRIAVIQSTVLYDARFALQILSDADFITMSTADPVRAVLRSLRNEAWTQQAQQSGESTVLPIPKTKDFKININFRRLNNLIQEIQIGEAMLSAALSGFSARRVSVDTGQLIDLKIPNVPAVHSDTPEKFSDIIQNFDEAISHIRQLRVNTPGIEMTHAPDIIGRAAAPVMAFVCGRNTKEYLPTLTENMKKQSVPLVYIDNGSDDGSVEMAEKLIGDGIEELHHLPYDGAFSVEAQLKKKHRLIERHAPRWIIHMDADEIIEHRDEGRTLLEIAQNAEKSEYNAINFNEFVFLPEHHQDFAGKDYAAQMRRYYLFEPVPFRLMRMWRHGLGLSNVADAGHRLSGPLRVAPVSHNLRHYMALSEEAAAQKYVGRPFAAAELAKKWHANRLGITRDDVRMPDAGTPRMSCLPPGQMKAFDRSRPQRTHWWKWRHES